MHTCRYSNAKRWTCFRLRGNPRFDNIMTNSTNSRSACCDRIGFLPDACFHPASSPSPFTRLASVSFGTCHALSTSLNPLFLNSAIACFMCSSDHLFNFCPLPCGNTFVDVDVGYMYSLALDQLLTFFLHQQLSSHVCFRPRLREYPCHFCNDKIA